MAASESVTWADGGWGPLAEDLAELAVGSDEAMVDALLARISALSADTIAGVDYASVTAWRGTGYTTVAASSESARAVDDAQHADQAGPCVLAAQEAVPIAVPDIGATMSWPEFHRRAGQLGLCTSVSVPLFAGSGMPLGALNLYSRKPSALTGLMAGVHEVFVTERVKAGGIRPDLDTGARQFLLGLAYAWRIRTSIQRAVDVVMARDGCDAGSAYVALRAQSAASGEPLSTVARGMIAAMAPGSDTDVWVTAGSGAAGVTRLSVGGELAVPVDTVAVARLASLAARSPLIELDLSGLRFCDVGGLRVLLGLHDQVVAAGGQIRVIAVSAPVRMLLQLTGSVRLLGQSPGDPVD
jgi:anti-anti-sigma factor